MHWVNNTFSAVTFPLMIPISDPKSLIVEVKSTEKERQPFTYFRVKKRGEKNTQHAFTSDSMIG